VHAPTPAPPVRATEPTVHLVEELPLTRLFGRQIQSQISLSHPAIVAVVGLFGNSIERDLCRPSQAARSAAKSQREFQIVDRSALHRETP